MDTWSADKVSKLLAVRPVTTRIRFSTRANLAQVDVYRRETFAPVVEMQLVKRGWVLSGTYQHMPPDVVGQFFRHREVTPERAAATRDVLLRYCAPAMPTAAVPSLVASLLALPAPPKRLALPAPSGIAIEVGARVVWTEHGLSLMPGQRRKDEVGVVEKIHYWSDHEPSVRIGFGERFDISYVSDVRAVARPAPRRLRDVDCVIVLGGSDTTIQHLPTRKKLRRPYNAKSEELLVAMDYALEISRIVF